MDKRGLKKLKKQARRELEEYSIILRRARKKLSRDDEVYKEAVDRSAALDEALRGEDPDLLSRTVEAMQEFSDLHLGRYRPNAFWEAIKALAIAVFIAFMIRWALVEPFRIPSGSMIPTLLIGDQLMVNKLSFGPDIYIPYLDAPDDDEFLEMARADGAYPIADVTVFGHTLSLASKKLWMRRLPERGEVVVFRFPADPAEDYIKRVVGIPGDTVEILEGKLYINEELQDKVRVTAYTGPVSDSTCDNWDLFEESLHNPGGARVHELIHCQDNIYRSMHSDYGPITVPEGHLFVMGDNRDRSYDSRGWGMVPVSNLKGAAMFIHLPLDPENLRPRWGRFFKIIR